MNDVTRIAVGIAVGLMLAALPFAHSRWGMHGEHASAPAVPIGGTHHAH